MIPLFKVTMSSDVTEELKKVLRSGFIGQGEKVEEFERDLKNVFGWQNCLTVNSGTSALQLALHLVKEKEGESVLLPPLSCFATTSAVIANNMVPEWVDIDPQTLIMDLGQLELKLNAQTRIIVIVHFAGATPDYHRLKDILDNHECNYGFRPIVIEDCAQSLGSVTNEMCGVGLNGYISCFSFQAVKTLTTGDGGAIVFPNDELYQRAKKLRWYGYDRDQKIDYQSIEESGFKYHMNDISATIGITNLKHLKKEEKFYTQMENYGLFMDEFQRVTQDMPCNGQFPILVNDLQDVIYNLKKNGVESFPAHFRCDKHKCVEKYKTYLPSMDYVERKMTMIPCGWWVPTDKLELIISSVRSINIIPWEREGF